MNRWQHPYVRRALVAVPIVLGLALMSRTGFFVKVVAGLANHCSVDEDCVSMSGKCPLDCYYTVNQMWSAPVRFLVESHVSTCDYKCRACRGATCSDNRCEPVCE